jgi:hypothetical protein
MKKLALWNLTTNEVTTLLTTSTWTTTFAFEGSTAPVLRSSDETRPLGRSPSHEAFSKQ